MTATAGTEAAIVAAAGDVSVRTVSFVVPLDEANFYARTAAEVVTAYLADLLGVTVVLGPGQADEFGSIVLSAERLGEMTGEAIVIIDRLGATATVTGNPRWANLPAVKAGCVYNAGSYLTFAGGGGGLTALRDQLVGIASFLATA